jgi:hypothetical protein
LKVGPVRGNGSEVIFRPERALPGQVVGRTTPDRHLSRAS